MAEVQGPHKNFRLETIGWQAFQGLSCTVAEVEFGRSVQRVAKVADEGRDGFFFGLPDKALDEKDDRETTIQCKHTTKSSTKLTVALLKDEFESVEKLVKASKASGYILFTNADLTEKNRTEIANKLKSLGVTAPRIYGSEWLVEKILEYPRIRALVPRIYGLGDLSWITEEKARKQAEAILASMGGDLACYVPTEAHREAVHALRKHRVALLLGDPAVGKSTIAAALAASATDEAKCEVFFIRSPEEFLDTWDPTLPNRLYWIDDAFGAIQFRQELMDRWNKVLTSFRAATQNENRFIFTSRSYIWRQAIKDLKNGVFPPLNDGQVVVNVESLTLAEKERILYNHLKFGSQDPSFLKRCIPFLDDLANAETFRPEMARRLGDPAFTKNLTVSAYGLRDFFKRAQVFLLDTLRQLDAPLQGALGLIFIENSRLEVPLKENDNTEIIRRCYGSSIAELNKSLTLLEGSFINRLEDSNGIYWTFKHPTLADAFSEFIAQDSTLVELYVEGCKLDDIIRDARCGQSAKEGSYVAIPPSLYEKVIERILNRGEEDWLTDLWLEEFLVSRCGDDFLGQYIAATDDEDIWKGGLARPVARNTHAKFILRAAKLGLFPSEFRSAFISQLREQIVNSGDIDFLLYETDFEEFLTEDEKRELMKAAREELIDELQMIIDIEAEGFTGDGDPDSHFNDLMYQVELLTDLFPGDDQVGEAVSKAVSAIEDSIDNLKLQFGDYAGEYDDDDFSMTQEAAPHGGRSIFDDLA